MYEPSGACFIPYPIICDYDGLAFKGYELSFYVARGCSIYVHIIPHFKAFKKLSGGRNPTIGSNGNLTFTWLLIESHLNDFNPFLVWWIVKS